MQCPGQDSRFWDGEAIFESHCPKCGGVVEFFKDDSRRRCRQCGHELLNPRLDFGCASYCPFAEQCLGSLSPEMLAQKQDLLLERAAIAMKGRLGADFAKIGQASRAARYAEQLAKTEEANKAVVVLAALLAELDGEVRAGERREPVAAQALLAELKANPGLAAEVGELLQHLGAPPGPEASVNQRVLHDAWLLAGIAHLAKTLDGGTEAVALSQGLVTVNGRLEGKKILAQ